MPKKEQKAIAVPEQNGHAISLIPEQGARIMEAMNGRIDEWAIMQREGRGNRTFDYVPHGYVTDQLNKTFGPFWDWERIDVSPGRKYDIHEYAIDAKDKNGVPTKKNIREVAVMGRLIIKIFSQDGHLIDTIVKTGSGAKVWEPNTNFADAEQSADSDALKRAAFRLGNKFGLQLYYDDEERRGIWQDKFMPKIPKNIAQFLTWMQKNDVSDEEYFNAVDDIIDNLTEAQVETAYTKIIEKRQDKEG